MNIVWFRRDLRLADHPALTAALGKDQPVTALFINYTEQHELHDEAPLKVDFIRANINDLVQRLEKLNVLSLVHSVKRFTDVPELMQSIISDHQPDRLLFNREYLLDEMQRDAAVKDVWEEHELSVETFDANYLNPPGKITKTDGDMYQVFTPYKKTAIEHMQENLPRPEAFPDKSEASPADLKAADELSHEYSSERWPVGEQAAHEQLKTFVHGNDYADERDYPGTDGTSGLSPYLASGIISARQCLRQAMKAGEDALHSVWVSELIWRDFYRDVVFDAPELCKHKPFKPDAMDEWQNDPERIEAWQQGQTGFPIVDAGMRQLQQTGWMHNRVRMITASFLTKLCLVDWRIGERYFMQHLLDGDFASNNGGWQWSSASGADAAPYFRIFNPTTQSEKYDPKGKYIRQYVPELESLSDKQLHNPSAEQREKLGYPAPVIDYSEARKTALDWFKSG